MTNTDLIREVTKEVAILKERIENVKEEIAGLRDLTTQVALMQQRLDDLREGWRIWAQRLWMILAPIAGVAIGYHLNKK